MTSFMRRVLFISALAGVVGVATSSAQTIISFGPLNKLSAPTEAFRGQRQPMVLPSDVSPLPVLVRPLTTPPGQAEPTASATPAPRSAPAPRPAPLTVVSPAQAPVPAPAPAVLPPVPTPAPVLQSAPAVSAPALDVAGTAANVATASVASGIIGA